MRIAEIYQSIQGEGRLTGAETVFLRASGCNLRCWFCDTPYASWKPEGTDLPVGEIVQQINSFNIEHVVLTGGEPMLFAELIPICERLNEAGKHITIETSGTLFLPVKCDLMSISPKFLSSAPAEDQHSKWHARHIKTIHNPQVIHDLTSKYDYQIKFVIDQPDDLHEVESYIAEASYLDRAKIMLMPQGTTEAELVDRKVWLEAYCKKNNLQYCPRKQIEWFGNVRQT